MNASPLVNRLSDCATPSASLKNRYSSTILEQIQKSAKDKSIAKISLASLLIISKKEIETILNKTLFPLYWKKAVKSYMAGKRITKLEMLIDRVKLEIEKAFNLSFHLPPSWNEKEKKDALFVIRGSEPTIRAKNHGQIHYVNQINRIKESVVKILCSHAEYILQASPLQGENVFDHLFKCSIIIHSLSQKKSEEEPLSIVLYTTDFVGSPLSPSIMRLHATTIARRKEESCYLIQSIHKPKKVYKALTDNTLSPSLLSKEMTKRVFCLGQVAEQTLNLLNKNSSPLRPVCVEGIISKNTFYLLQSYLIEQQQNISCSYNYIEPELLDSSSTTKFKIIFSHNYKPILIKNREEILVCNNLKEALLHCDTGHKLVVTTEKEVHNSELFFAIREKNVPFIHHEKGLTKECEQLNSLENPSPFESKKLLLISFIQGVSFLLNLKLTPRPFKEEEPSYPIPNSQVYTGFSAGEKEQIDRLQGHIQTINHSFESDEEVNRADKATEAFKAIQEAAVDMRGYFLSIKEGKIILNMNAIDKRLASTLNEIETALNNRKEYKFHSLFFTKNLEKILIEKRNSFISIFKEALLVSYYEKETSDPQLLQFASCDLTCQSLAEKWLQLLINLEKFSSEKIISFKKFLETFTKKELALWISFSSDKKDHFFDNPKLLLEKYEREFCFSSFPVKDLLIIAEEISSFDPTVFHSGYDYEKSYSLLLKITLEFFSNQNSINYLTSPLPLKIGILNILKKGLLLYRNCFGIIKNNSSVNKKRVGEWIKELSSFSDYLKSNFLTARQKETPFRNELFNNIILSTGSNYHEIDKNIVDLIDYLMIDLFTPINELGVFPKDLGETINFIKELPLFTLLKVEQKGDSIIFYSCFFENNKNNLLNIQYSPGELLLFTITNFTKYGEHKKLHTYLNILDFFKIINIKELYSGSSTELKKIDFSFTVRENKFILALKIATTSPWSEDILTQFFKQNFNVIGQFLAELTQKEVMAKASLFALILSYLADSLPLEQRICYQVNGGLKDMTRYHKKIWVEKLYYKAVSLLQCKDKRIVGACQYFILRLQEKKRIPTVPGQPFGNSWQNRGESFRIRQNDL